ncbi:M28 family peptidase [Nannocystis pusilla]|uniref:M28 family peptidase n=1 Tax=Nannocystis pusilla TaxID=889268 RepID=UPI003B790009
MQVGPATDPPDDVARDGGLLQPRAGQPAVPRQPRQGAARSRRLHRASHNLRGLRSTYTLARGLRAAEARTFALPTGIKGEWIPTSCRSDHVPFWELGYPAVLVTDTAGLRNPNYHEPSDTPDTLDYEFLETVSRGLVTGIGRLVGARAE